MTSWWVLPEPPPCVNVEHDGTPAWWVLDTPEGRLHLCGRCWFRYVALGEITIEIRAGALDPPPETSPGPGAAWGEP